MSQLTKGKSKARDPPPALFLHPSRTASHASLPGMTGMAPPGAQATAGAPPPGGQKQPDGGSRTSPVEPRRIGVLRGNSYTTSGVHAHPHAPNLDLNIPPSLLRGDSTRTTDRTDALWAEMQATLEEVELSAGGGTRVFGPDHDRKLGELRMAQIALAQAWARSEADDAIETTGSGLGETRNVKFGGASGTETGADGAGKTEAGTATDGGAKSTGTGSVRPVSSGVGATGQEKLGEKQDEEPVVDILLARKRREANDRYFQRVNQGVLDVVAKLEEVATAMRDVEQESKDIWAEETNDSAPGSAKA
ncbi:hypothetical protein B0T22DRAFT_470047 [Podospora appendiculata]|uniref:Uncharacterized protein n=1 Tax=Podospora appendiculata TaxID=314037 RepID=A0AAE0X3X2_9PEZI|nr:hypothetical protein B0T22DRAFT_470047 [Podospora appendiculata]